VPARQGTPDHILIMKLKTLAVALFALTLFGSGAFAQGDTYDPSYPYGQDGDVGHPDGYNGFPGDTPPGTEGAPAGTPPNGGPGGSGWGTGNGGKGGDGKNGGLHSDGDGGNGGGWR